jgi:hypothetical protein
LDLDASPAIFAGIWGYRKLLALGGICGQIRPIHDIGTGFPWAFGLVLVSGSPQTAPDGIRSSVHIFIYQPVVCIATSDSVASSGNAFWFFGLYFVLFCVSLFLLMLALFINDDIPKLKALNMVWMDPCRKGVARVPYSL